jgi:hypothetical protein
LNSLVCNMMKVFTRPTSVSDFYFPHMKILNMKIFIANFHVLGLFTPKKRV